MDADCVPEAAARAAHGSGVSRMRFFLGRGQTEDHLAANHGHSTPPHSRLLRARMPGPLKKLLQTRPDSGESA